MSNTIPKTLTNRETCRLRLPVFFGSFDSRDMAFIETIMNSRDELVNHCNWNGEISITLSDDCKKITIEDNGRGIPLSTKDENGEYNYIKLFETLFSGCNFDNSFSEDVIETIGQNGCGQTVTAMTSTFYRVTEFKNNIAREVSYRNGCLERTYREYQCDRHSGTKTEFILDDTVYTNTVFDAEYIRDYIKKISSTTKNIKYTFTYKDNTDLFIYESIDDYMENIVVNAISNPIHFGEKTYEFECSKEGKAFTEKDRVEVYLSLSTEPVQETYLNGGYLEENGTFYNGIVDGVKKYFQKHMDKKTKLTNQDIEMSFNIYGIMGSNNPIYSNQTKKASSNELYKKLVSEYIIENMEVFKAENQQEFDKILKHLQQINSFNTKNENSIKNIKKKLSEKSDVFSNRVEGLVDCREHGSNSELFIAEGKSALASIIASRNANFQAGLAVRGKTLSVLKASVDQIFNSQIIVDIIKTLGCGCELKNGKKKLVDEFNIDKLRYGKIILTVDADADGSSIVCLLCTTFYRLMPELLRQGKVYLAKTPLYEITTKQGKLLYAFTDKDKDDICENNQVLKIQRNKGLGEVDASVMAETTMNPNTRVIEKIIINNEDDMDYYFNKWMGNDVSIRKNHIEENLYQFANNLD